ncbi:MAG: methyltransferase domain-containing protein [Thermoplasmata archaeon]
MKVPDQAQFHRFAVYYDLLNETKDYHLETVRLAAIAKRFSTGSPRTWLDVACGTGRHLEYLRHRYDATGLDLSREMLRIARRRLPGTPLLRGDMRTFRTGHTFDVVSCLFSAIGHLRTRRDVQGAFANFYRHLNPGGVAIVEPWIDPAVFHAGFVQLRTYEGTKGLIARMAFSGRQGNRSIVDFHFLIGKHGDGVRFFVESDIGLLLSRKQLMGLMGSAGFKTHFLTKGFTTGRGLLVGVRPRLAK